jgi:hypothetical protein
MRPILKVIFIIFLFALHSAYGQEMKKTSDIGLWTSFTAKFEINKKWETSATQELRTFNNAGSIQKSITDFDLDYKINKEFSLRGGLRYAYNREKDNLFSQNIRYNLDFKYKRKLSKDFDLQYRFRYQSNYESPFTGFSDFRQTDKTRNRLKIEYDGKRHSPYFGTELFREHVYYKRAKFKGLRLTLGDEFESKLGEINYGFGYERELNADHPLNFYFLRLNYTIEFENE